MEITKQPHGFHECRLARKLRSVIENQLGGVVCWLRESCSPDSEFICETADFC